MKNPTTTFKLFFLPWPRSREIRECPIRARTRIEAIKKGRQHLFRRYPNYVLLPGDRKKAEIFARLAL